jgi:hypothetical protein
MNIVVRYSVAFAIIVPLFLLFGRGLVAGFGIALLGFGAGRIVEWLVYGPPTGVPARSGLAAPGVMAAVGLAVVIGCAFLESRLEATRAEAVDEARKVLER